MMFALTRNKCVVFRQLIHKSKQIHCQQHPIIQENNVSISSHFSTGIRGGNLQQSKNLTKFEKRILVYNKNFKTLADVPDSVPISVLNKAKDWSRVRISIWMIGVTVVSCIAMVLLGRRGARQGDGIQKRNLEWHRQYNEKAKADEVAAAAEKEA